MHQCTYRCLCGFPDRADGNRNISALPPPPALYSGPGTSGAEYGVASFALSLLSVPLTYYAIKFVAEGASRSTFLLGAIPIFIAMILGGIGVDKKLKEFAIGGPVVSSVTGFILLMPMIILFLASL